MKKANQILNSVKSRPNFKSIHKYSCLNKLQALLPARFQKAIAFFYIRNNTLFGGLSHPGYKMELNYNKDLVKSLLKELSFIEQSCKETFSHIEKVEFFVSKYHTKPESYISNSDPKYRELAYGDFEIQSSKDELTEIFKKIREDILRNREDN
ncbi:MAG TPA: hypothetical protein ENK87_00270 [Nitratifractor sp.]|nr:hypothetical protein [Nitratifractor sp.]